MYTQILASMSSVNVDYNANVHICTCHDSASVRVYTNGVNGP